MVRDYELFRQNIERLKQYEYQLSIYKKSGIDSHMEEIKTLKENIEFYRNNIITLQRDLEDINRQLERVDEEITVVTKYNDGKKYEKIFQSTLESTNKILVPLESASQEKMELEFALRQVTNTITSQRESHKELENKISEYKRLISEGEELSKKHKDLSLILDTVSTKKGIPVIYMKRYLGKIQQLANNLLKLIYNDALQIAKFKVTQDTFEVPYIKNGTLIPDVKYASQSEVALITMALSFALANKSSGDYNILLLDEIEGGLDETNRGAFLTMLYIQMNALNAEQVFIISQNLSQMVNVPMDCILLSEYGTKSKLQNVIYE
jgi:DNA repair exonuclease SbcCD ATPase subunit